MLIKITNFWLLLIIFLQTMVTKLEYKNLIN